MINNSILIVLTPLIIFTGHNFVIFLHLSVIHSVHGGVSASVHAGIPPPPQQTPLQTRHPLGQDTPPPLGPDMPPWNQTPPLDQTSPRPDTHLWDQTPPPPIFGGIFLGAILIFFFFFGIRTHVSPPAPREADSGRLSTSGRYASYWNAFLFKTKKSKQGFSVQVSRFWRYSPGLASGIKISVGRQQSLVWLLKKQFRQDKEIIFILRSNTKVNYGQM